MNRRRAAARLDTGLLDRASARAVGPNGTAPLPDRLVDPTTGNSRSSRFGSARAQRLADGLGVALVIAGLALSLLVVLFACCLLADAMYSWGAR